jgi:hypothetical protein
MSLCVALQADGTLTQTGQAVETCTGYVLVSSAEYGGLQFAANVFAMPTQDEANAVALYVFGAILTLYIAGRCAGAVVAMFSRAGK